MNKPGFVFLDPHGRRWRWVRLVVFVAILVTLTAFVVFIRALLVQPELRLPESVRTIKSELKALSKTTPQANTAQPWLRFRPPSGGIAKAKSPTPGGHVSAALLTGWDTRSLTSLTQHASSLTHICPEMLTVTGQPAKIQVEDDPDGMLALRATKLPLIPVLSNLKGNQWDTDAIEGVLLGTPAAQQEFIKQILAVLQGLGAHGVLLDWQGLDPTYAPRLTAFLAQLRDALHQQKRALWISIPVGDDLRAFDLDHLPASVDYMVAQLHDKNAEDDPPGPVASQEWFEGWLKTLLNFGEPRQWIVSLGAYGYDWNKSTKKTTTVSFADAMARAQSAGVEPVTSAGPEYNPGFEYDSQGQSHEVWFLDAATFANQLRVTSEENCGGIMVNQLGTEDPAIWPILNRRSPNALPTLNQEQTITPNGSIAQLGDGDFLRAELDTQPGQRSFETDKDGYIVEHYQKWPSYPTVIHLGETGSQKVALTFDDGPDPEWTPKILDILKQRKVHATFFVLGVHAEQHPELIRRILHEGHEIGTHTYSHPNLAEASPEQVRLELNATQRLLEWINHRSVILFRPPYNGDSMPSTLADVRPIAQASDMGYIIAGESVDPQDWSRPGTEEIIQRVREQRANGNVILLHDAGGDRSQTVAALPHILDYLETRGDTIVRLGKLIDLSRDQTMPPLQLQSSTGPRFIANAGLLFAHWAEEFLWAFMIVTSILTVGRSILLGWLAVRRKNAPPATEPPTFALSVVIAAYNEEKVIEGTLKSVLDTDYTGPLEVIVIDDGSKDKTTERAQLVADHDPRLRVIRQANTGKAGALAHGTQIAQNEILVYLDADTHFQPDTLRKLAEGFSKPDIGAVSGHARVGNLKTWIARFQSLEYICGFNLDRRAYDYLNAITVAPGAISAFRREAIEDAGGFAHDTLAEDTDLTLSLHRSGWIVTYAPEAIAWTEAPETIKALASQRFRWAFGTMQCLWKHRDMIFNPRFGALAMFSLPSIVLFQIFLIACAPIVDLLLCISIASGAGLPFILYFAAFLLCDLFLAMLACKIEREPMRRALWIIPMRFVYRPILSWVVWRSILQIMRGAWVGWGKLERKGGIVVPPSAS